MALMRRGAPAPPPLRLGALLVLCSLSGLAVPVGSGSTAGELSAAALLLPLLPLLPPPVALADSHAALHADLKDKTRAQLTRKLDAGEQLAGVKAASFTAAGAGMSEYVYCPGIWLGYLVPLKSAKVLAFGADEIARRCSFWCRQMRKDAGRCYKTATKRLYNGYKTAKSGKF